MNKRYIVLIILGALVFTGIAVSLSPEEAEMIRRNETASMATMEITAHDLVAEFRKNKVAAFEKFEGNRLLVTGIVDAIDLDLLDKPMVVLKGIGFSNVHVVDIPGDVAATISTGSKITLACTQISDAIGSPVLQGCALQ